MHGLDSRALCRYPLLVRDDTNSRIFQFESGNSGGVVRLIGELNAPNVASAWSALSELKGIVRVDASKVLTADGAGLALLWQLQSQGAKLEGLKPEISALLSPFGTLKPPAKSDAVEREGLVVSVGRAGAGFLDDIGTQITFVGALAAQLTKCAIRPRLVRWADMWVIAQKAGVNALVVAGMVSFLTGVIMAFQAAVPLRQFGVDIFVVNLVALALLRELGPIMTAVVFAGRSGSAFAAEIGTMKVNEELNALETMGLDPMRFLVVPRVLAGFIVTPILTIYANLLGIAGGFFVMMLQGFPFAALWNQLLSAITIHDVLTGLIKSFVFGVLVAGIGCLRGLQTGTGAEAVGVSTTRAVVSGIFLIVVVDAIFAVVFYVIKW